MKSIELDRIIQRALVNEAALTTSPYQLPDLLQELIVGVANNGLLQNFQYVIIVS